MGPHGRKSLETTLKGDMAKEGDKNMRFFIG